MLWLSVNLAALVHAYFFPLLGRVNHENGPMTDYGSVRLHFGSLENVIAGPDGAELGLGRKRFKCRDGRDHWLLVSAAGEQESEKQNTWEFHSV